MFPSLDSNPDSVPTRWHRPLNRFEATSQADHLTRLSGRSTGPSSVCAKWNGLGSVPSEAPQTLAGRLLTLLSTHNPPPSPSRATQAAMATIEPPKHSAVTPNNSAL